MVFRQNASTVLHLAGDTEDDTQDLLIGNLAKIICDDVKQIDHDQSRYNIRITKEDTALKGVFFPSRFFAVPFFQKEEQNNLAFLRDITNNEACQEYIGYYTMVTRKQGVSIQPKTKAVYLPLIDMTLYTKHEALLALIVLSVCTCISQRMVTFSFSVTVSGWCSYHLSFALMF